MKSISITTYRGFSKVKGKCSLQELIGWVRRIRQPDRENRKAGQ